MPYVQYDSHSNIIGLYANPQGFAQTFLQDSDPSVVAFLNPPEKAAEAQYNSAISAGLATVWQASVGLNATYPLGEDPITGLPIMALINSEMVSISVNGTFTNGEISRNWPDASGAMHLFTIAQAKALFTAIALYIDQCASALAAMQQGQTPTWPASSVTINA